MTRDIFNRTEKLIGTDAVRRLQETEVLLVGAGGVGSWCAEALVRSGVEHITVADPDRVCASNVNRQLMATSATIGQPKVRALAARLSEIDPDAVITVMETRFCQDSIGEFELGRYDYIIDAIDNVADKAQLILSALRTDAVLFSSMGAALKLDPSQIAVAEFWKVYGCPLAKALRNRFKKTGDFPSRKFRCVFSPERLANRFTDDDPGNGTAVHITASFGFRLASLLVSDVVNRLDGKCC